MANTLRDTNISDVYSKLIFTKEDSAAEAKLYATDSSAEDREITGFATALSFTGKITAEAGVQLGNNRIYASDGGSAITLDVDDNVAITGDLTVTGNDIKSSSATAITMSGANVAIAGDLTITGGNITNAITCDSTLTSTGDITCNGGDISIVGAEAGAATLVLSHDESDDNGDDWKIISTVLSDKLSFQNDISGSDVAQFEIIPNATVASSYILVPGTVRTTKLEYTDGDDCLTIADGGGATFSAAATFNENVTLAANKDLRFNTQMDIHNGSSAFLSFASTGVTVGQPLIISGGVTQSVKKMADADVTLTAADSGKYIIVEHATSASRDLILPAVADGLNFKVRISLDLANILEIKAAATGNFLEGGVTFIDTNTDAATTTFDTQILASSSDEGISIKADTKAGSWVELVCDGTTWFISGTIYADTAPDYVDV